MTRCLADGHFTAGGAEVDRSRVPELQLHAASKPARGLLPPRGRARAAGRRGAAGRQPAAMEPERLRRRLGSAFRVRGLLLRA